ncbi:hypothetical protein E2C01_044518 [Portunus trituberculatus]|uniref:Uncharacterized protein n=1 Tax=Portunus trituberculatus TaxID=210409 RepID=A0A5B7FZJ9_PORTR|nr:hypothetical protein [Portunus trituberculatus]
MVNLEKAGLRTSQARYWGGISVELEYSASFVKISWSLLRLSLHDRNNHADNTLEIRAPNTHHVEPPAKEH